ncbi:MAG: tetratricopeptide repeat protein [Verrucomicrobiota bacterium]
MAGSLCLDVRAGKSVSAKERPTPLVICDACKIILIPPHGTNRSDLELLTIQQKIKKSSTPGPLIEQLGWLFVSKARSGNDAGYYNLVEQTALCLEAQQPESSGALLLRGHSLQSMHKFKEAEPIARKLVEKRGASFDYGLLGDILIDRGQMLEGIEAYQKMIELRPDLHSYTRAAHARWLKGDVEGAEELISMATSAGSSRDAEATAWSYTRRAAYELQLGHLSESLRAANVALQLQPDYAAALFFKGRIQIAQGQTNDAIASLTHAVKLTRLPEYQWLISDLLNLSGKKSEAGAVELELSKHGAQEDPRTLALYLATRRTNSEVAVKLAERELTQRADIFTHDALAWALHSAGKFTEAREQSKLALREGTEDARLFFHAAVIAQSDKDPKAALAYSKRATAIQQMLFPSEQKQLAELNGRVVGAQSQAKIKTSESK